VLRALWRATESLAVRSTTKACGDIREGTCCIPTKPNTVPTEVTNRRCMQHDCLDSPPLFPSGRGSSVVSRVITVHLLVGLHNVSVTPIWACSFTIPACLLSLSGDGTSRKI
jgi:hypothetical protein